MKIDPDELYNDIIQEHPELNTREVRHVVWEMCYKMKEEIDRVGKFA